MKKNIIYLSLFLIITTAIKVQGQEGIAQLKNFRYGKLQNGFSYFIKHLEEPKDKTSMRFYIKVGINQEDSSQLQVAHLLEHVAFKPSEKFPEGIMAELHKLNMSTRDIGGTTGYKSTRYLFDAPSQNKEAVVVGLRWFKEIAAGLRLSDKDIDQERGSVRQEFLFGKIGGLEKVYAERDLEAKLFPCRGSFNSFLDHIQKFPSANLRRFYKKWYRPDLMGVMIVGNIKDMDAAEQRIKSIFKNIPRPIEPIKETNCDDSYFARSPQFVVEELKENTVSSKEETVKYRLFFRQPELAKNMATKKGYKEYIAFQFFLEIMKNRFRQKKRNDNLSFQVKLVNSYKHGFPLSYSISFKSEASLSAKAFHHVFESFHQLSKYGVLEKEWKEVKEKYLGKKVQKNERYWHQQLWDYFIKDEALFANKLEFLRLWVQELSVDGFNAIINQFLTSMPEDIGIITPTGSKALQYTETQVRAWIIQSNQQPVSPYRLPKIIREVLTLEEVNELKEMGYKDLGWKKNGTKEIVLKNGAKVVLKPFRPTAGIGDDKVSLHGFSKIGADCFPKSDYYTALNVPAIIEYTGVGGLSNAQIRSFKKIANISSCTPYIDYKESGIHGLASIKNIEELLQLVYLYYAQPEFELQQWEHWKKTKMYNHQKKATQDFRNKIRYFFKDSTLSPTLGYRYLKSTEAYKSIQKTDGKRGYEIYQQIFGQPQEFTFIITGDFEVKNVVPLLQKYLGNIPRNIGSLTCKDREKMIIPIKTGPVYKYFITDRYKMKNVKYNLSYIKEREKNDSWKETLKIQVLGELADIELKRLRYEKGFALYNFRASGRYNPDESRYNINFDITCQMEELKPIQKECEKIIQEIKRGEIKRDHFQQAIKKLRRRYAKQNLFRHRKMQKLLYEHLRYDKPWIESEQYDKFLQSLEIQDMVETANEYFKKKHQYEFVMNDKKLGDT